MALAAATRYYPGLESFLLWLVPTSIRKIQHDHYATALDKIHRRMDLTTERDDFMTPMIENNPRYEKMSIPEIESTTALLLIAGSETTGTTLCGITNCLVQNPLELRKLETEIRRRFAKESDMTHYELQKLPFLNAVISEGLRLCNPVAGGILRIVPKGGATVCGYSLPEGVSILNHNNYGENLLIASIMPDPRRRQYHRPFPLRRQLPPCKRLPPRSLPPGCFALRGI